MSDTQDRADPAAGGGVFWRQGLWWRRAGTTSAAVWLSTGLAFLGTVIAARGLGPHGYGTVVLAIAAATFLGTFLDLTLEEAVVHYGFRTLAEEGTGALRSLIRTSFSFDLIVGLAIAALIAGFAGPISDIGTGGTVDPNLIRLAALATLASTVDGTTGAALLLLGRADLRGWTLVVTNVARLVATVVAVVLGGPGLVVCAYIAGNVAGALFQGAYAWRLGRRAWPPGGTPRSPREWLRPLAKFGFHTSLTTSLASSERSLVPLIVGGIVGPAGAGLYNIALFPLTVVSIATGSIRLLLFPEQAKLAARGDIGALRQTVRGFTLAALAIGIPVAVAGWFLLPWLIPTMFGDAFADAVTPARIVLIAAVGHFAAGAWAKTLPAAIGKPQLRSLMTGVIAASSLTLTVLLAPHYGVEGAAIAHTVGSLGTYVIWWILSERALRELSASPPPPLTPPLAGEPPVWSA